MKQKEKSVGESKGASLASDLCKQIESRRGKLDLSVRALERKAGLNIGAVNNILHGVSSNPTAETLIALANVFGCSIDELLGRQSKESSLPKKTEIFLDDFAQFPWNQKLFEEAASILNKELYSRKNPKLTSKQAISIIHELYLYSLKKGKDHIEESMADWLLDKEI